MSWFFKKKLLFKLSAGCYDFFSPLPLMFERNLNDVCGILPVEVYNESDPEKRRIIFYLFMDPPHPSRLLHPSRLSFLFFVVFIVFFKLNGIVAVTVMHGGACWRRQMGKCDYRCFRRLLEGERDVGRGGGGKKKLSQRRVGETKTFVM